MRRAPRPIASAPSARPPRVVAAAWQASYAEARIAADSQEACLSYGLVRGTERYERCVQREIAYRRPA